MANRWDIQPQAKPGAASLTDLYTVPTGSSFVGHVSCCNQSTATTIRVSLAPLGAADATSQYIAYDLPLSANNVYQTEEFSIGGTGIVRVRSASGGVSFTLMGVLK